MLDGFRKIGNSLVGRLLTVLLFGMLIFSFGIWGIGDMIRNFNANAIAKIGTQEIGVLEFRAAYQNEIQSISNRIRRNLSSQEALAFGLDRRVLDRMINEKILDQFITDWKLEFGQDAIAKAILTDPNFAGADGKFSRALFDEALRQSGYTEDGFLAGQRVVYLRGQIAEAMAGSMSAPPSMIAMLHRYRQEQRSITMMTLKAEPAASIAAPTDVQLTAFLNERKHMRNCVLFSTTVPPLSVRLNIAVLAIWPCAPQSLRQASPPAKTRRKPSMKKPKPRGSRPKKRAVFASLFSLMSTKAPRPARP